VRIDSASLGKSTVDVCIALGNGIPRIFVGEKGVPDGILNISALSLPENMLEPVGKRLREVFGG